MTQFVPFRAGVSAAVVMSAIMVVVPSANAAGVETVPTAWGTLADGGGGSIDGVIDWSELGSRIIAGYSSTTSEIFHGVMEFVTPAGFATITDATLALDIYHISDFEQLNYSVYGYAGDGVVTNTDFNTGSEISRFDLTETDTVEIDVTRFIQASINSSAAYVGFVLRPNGDPYTQDTAVRFSSPTQPDTTTSSSLRIIPEPASGFLLNLGVGGVMLLRRRRK